MKKGERAVARKEGEREGKVEEGGGEKEGEGGRKGG